jgi:hypothetical protein
MLFQSFMITHFNAIVSNFRDHPIKFQTNICTEFFLNAAHSQFFLSSKCRVFHNATFFGFCIIRILHIGCAKI